MHVSKTRLPVPLTVALTCRCPVDALTEAGWRTIAQVMPMGYPYYARHVLRYIEKYIYVYLTEKNIYIYMYISRVLRFRWHMSLTPVPWTAGPLYPTSRERHSFLFCPLNLYLGHMGLFIVYTCSVHSNLCFRGGAYGALLNRETPQTKNVASLPLDFVISS